MTDRPTIETGKVTIRQISNAEANRIFGKDETLIKRFIEWMMK